MEQQPVSINRPLDAPRPIPWGSFFFGIAGVILTLIAIANHNIHVAILSVPFFFLFVSLMLSMPQPLQGELTAAALNLENPPRSIPFADIQSVWANGKFKKMDEGTRSFTIDIAHREGLLRIPPARTPTSAEIYRSLFAALPRSGGRVTQPDLVQFLEDQEMNFGPERVQSYVARRFLPGRLALRRRMAIFGALVLSGVAWIALSFLNKDVQPWVVTGGMMVVFPFLLGLQSWAETNRPPGNLRHWRGSGLVISPVGMAMIQGKMGGKLRWNEVKKVSMNSKIGALSISQTPGIILQAEGVQIVIADIYDRPLPLILDQIRTHWSAKK